MGYPNGGPGTPGGLVVARSGNTSAAMQRLRRVSSDSPGIARRRRGRGFTYAWPNGATVADEETLARVRGLTIPPAWSDVWICPDAMGHLQASGVDAAGRRQYLYHERWRARRDAEKFDRMLAFAHRLPEVRRRVRTDLGLRGLPRDKALAVAARLLDLGLFRVGSESYMRANGSFGLATIRRDHVRTSGDAIRFDYRAKSGQRRIQEIADPEVARIVRTLKRRRDDNPELLAYRNGTGWRDVRSEDVNAYVKDVAGDAFSAKDFRTWHGTVYAAVALAAGGEVPRAQAARRRRISAAVKEVAAELGNTPAVARASYIDPRLLDRYEEGATILPALAGTDAFVRGEGDGLDPSVRDAVEAAVLELLGGGRPERAAA
jgi:DNA topoisomerase I